MGSKDSDSDCNDSPFAGLAPGVVVSTTFLETDASQTGPTAPDATHEDTQASSIANSQELLVRTNSLDKAGNKMLSRVPARMILELIDAVNVLALFAITWATG